MLTGLAVFTGLVVLVPPAVLSGASPVRAMTVLPAGATAAGAFVGVIIEAAGAWDATALEPAGAGRRRSLTECAWGAASNRRRRDAGAVRSLEGSESVSATSSAGAGDRVSDDGEVGGETAGFGRAGAAVPDARSGAWGVGATRPETDDEWSGIEADDV